MEPPGADSLLQSRRGSSHLGCDGGFWHFCPAAESFRSVFAGVLCNVFHDVTNYMHPFSLHANWVRGACMGLRLDFYFTNSTARFFFSFAGVVSHGLLLWLLRRWRPICDACGGRCLAGISETEARSLGGAVAVAKAVGWMRLAWSGDDGMVM
jgi:hypothetical protein